MLGPRGSCWIRKGESAPFHASNGKKNGDGDNISGKFCCLLQSLSESSAVGIKYKSWAAIAGAAFGGAIDNAHFANYGHCAVHKSNLLVYFIMLG